MAGAPFGYGLLWTALLSMPLVVSVQMMCGRLGMGSALAEAAAWKGSPERKLHRARKFYAVLTISLVLGCALDYAGLDAMKLLFWSAVINGALAPPLILLVLLLTSNPEVMGDRVTPPLMKAFGWVTFALMSAATVGILFP